MLHCNMKLAWQYQPCVTISPAWSRHKARWWWQPAASGCSARTKSRDAGTAKWANKAARSAHCSMKTSRSGFSQSTCTACEMQPGSRARAMDMLEAQFADLVEAYPGRAVTLPVTTIIAFLPLRSSNRRRRQNPPAAAASASARRVRHRSGHRCRARRDRTSHRRYAAGFSAASGISGLRSRTRRGPPDSAEAQASACWR